MNKQGLRLEVRSITDMLYVEKLWFMEENQSTEGQIFFEIINCPYKLLESIEAKMYGDLLKPVHDHSHKCHQKQICYIVWVDRDENVIKPDVFKYKFAKEGDMFTVM